MPHYPYLPSHGWPGLTEPWPAGGGEFRCAGAVPAGRKLGEGNIPASVGRLSGRSGSDKGVPRESRNRVQAMPSPAAFVMQTVARRAGRSRGCITTPDAGLTHPGRGHRGQCRAVAAGEGGFGRMGDRTGRNRPGLEMIFRQQGCHPVPGRRGTPLISGARAAAPSHILPPPRASRPRPARPDCFRTRRCLKPTARSFARGGLVSDDGGDKKGNATDAD